VAGCWQIAGPKSHPELFCRGFNGSTPEYFQDQPGRLLAGEMLLAGD